MDNKSKIILISGPTASGKSSFAIKLAKKINGEIINADSMQVYKELQILTARPKKNNLKGINHYLYGFQSVKKNFSTGKWQILAKKKIKEIKKKNKVPILVGGTGLYFKVITDGLVRIPNIPVYLRNKIRTFQKRIGQDKFYQKLIKLDSLAKDKINSNDVQRSIRAYEVKKYTKISLIEWFKKTNKNFENNDFLKIYIDFPRPELIKRINRRVEEMFKEGAINEIKKFLKLNVKKDKSSNKIIGIKEIDKYLKGDLDLKATKEIMAIKTRQYAKRQSTWARGQMLGWQKIDYKDLVSFLKKI
jgi:tRNA dimethylallyltransferase|tara:strand:- start:441 stop:1349 length:909 start_codon:yes stop_codon:yes gene_type:complete